MEDWATYLLEIRSPYDDWQSRFERELGWDLTDGMIQQRFWNRRYTDHGAYRTIDDFEESSYREPIGLFELRDADRVRAQYGGPFWDEPACPFVGPRRAVLAVCFETWSKEYVRRFGIDAGRAARGLVLDLGRVGQRRAAPLVHRTVDICVAHIDVERVRRYGASRSTVHSILKHGSGLLIFEDDGPYLDYVASILSKLEKTRDGEFRYVDMWRYTFSFSEGPECYLFEC